MNKDDIKQFSKITMAFSGLYLIISILLGSISVAYSWGGINGFFAFFGSMFGSFSSPSYMMILAIATLVLSVILYKEYCQKHTKNISIWCIVLSLVLCFMIMCQAVSSFFYTFVGQFQWISFVRFLMYISLIVLYILALIKFGLLNKYVPNKGTKKLENKNIYVDNEDKEKDTDNK